MNERSVINEIELNDAKDQIAGIYTLAEIIMGRELSGEEKVEIAARFVLNRREVNAVLDGVIIDGQGKQ